MAGGLIQFQLRGSQGCGVDRVGKFDRNVLPQGGEHTETQKLSGAEKAGGREPGQRSSERWQRSRALDLAP